MIRNNSAEKRVSKKWKRILPILLAAFGILVACYPWISNFINSREANSIASTYQNQTKDMSKKALSEELKKAKAYNHYLLGEQNDVKITDPFKATLRKAQKEPYPYKNILNFGGGVMGWIRIPSIGVKLPIYHGVSAEVLDKGVGHIPGTSFPVGGKSTHAVLTGHTGLSKAKLFTDLPKMKKNDLFFIYVGGKTLAYKVHRMYIIKPSQVDSLRVEKGKDKVTLLTCYPYGVNSHRYCVEGVRTEYNGQDKILKDKVPADSDWMKSYLKGLLLGLMACAGIITIHQLIKRRKVQKTGTILLQNKTEEMQHQTGSNDPENGHSDEK